ncbi:MAG: sialyltransferase [Myxococcota bacterium]
MKEISVKEICENFFEMENKYDLLNQEFDQVKVWQLLRMILYYKVALKTGTFTKPHAEKIAVKDIIKSFFFFFYASLKNPLQGNYQKDILVFDHSRKVMVDDEYVDIYTKYLLEELNPESYDVYESYYLGQHLSKKSHNRKYLDVLSVFSYLYSKLGRVNISQNQKNLIKKLEKEFKQRFGVELHLQPLFEEEILNFKFGFRFYDLLLKKRKPKKIYLVVSYSFYKRPLIAAAKKNGIPTIELQHGTISPYHLGYNFPGSKELDYFPDYFHSFGDYWTNIVNMPLPPENIINRGFAHFRAQKNKFGRLNKNSRQVLLVSQGAIGRQLSTFAYEAALIMPDYQFVHKLHPEEYSIWQSDYPALVKASELPNFTVIDHNKNNLYEYFSESSTLIGVFSTALYEGLAFGCNTFVVDLPGVEYMDLLVEKGIVTKVNRAKELKESIGQKNRNHGFTFF